MCNNSGIDVDDTLVIFHNVSIFTERNLRAKTDSRNRWICFEVAFSFVCFVCFVVHRHYITSSCYEMPLRNMLTWIHPLAFTPWQLELQISFHSKEIYFIFQIVLQIVSQCLLHGSGWKMTFMNRTSFTETRKKKKMFGKV